MIRRATRCIGPGLLLAAAGACSANVYYVGSSHVPTRSVHVYYTSEEIRQPYQVMGRAVASGTQRGVLQHLVNRACDEGADGVLITDVGLERVRASFIKFLPQR